MGPAASDVRWIDPDHVAIGEVEFRLHDTRRHREEAVLLLKSPELVRDYLGLADELVGSRLIEVGVYQGGSTIFLDQLARPATLVAVDIAPRPPRALAAYLADDPEGDRAARILPRFGVDQQDRAALVRIADEVPGGELDVVIDDASHLLAPSLVTFEVLFPRLRPGGLFLLEDWSAPLQTHAGVARAQRAAAAEAFAAITPERLAQLAVDDVNVLRALCAAGGADLRRHLAEHVELADRLRTAHPDEMAVIEAGGELAPDPTAPAVAATPQPTAPTELGLTPLVAHLQHAALARPGVVASLRVRAGFTVVRRGPDPLDPTGFSLADLVPSGLPHSAPSP